MVKIHVLILVMLSASEHFCLPDHSDGFEVDNLRVLPVPHPVNYVEESQVRVIPNANQTASRQGLTARMLHATVLGLIAGGIRTEAEMKENLVKEVTTLLDTMNNSTYIGNLQKIQSIEMLMQRDRRAFDILLSSLDLLIGTKTFVDYKQEMTEIANKNYHANLKFKSTYQRDEKKFSNKNDVIVGLKSKLTELNQYIPVHLEYIHSRLLQRTKEAKKYLQANEEIAIQQQQRDHLGSEFIAAEKDIFNRNLRNKRQEDREELEEPNGMEEPINDIETKKKESQEAAEDNDDESEEGPPAVGLDLVGLIAGLSGGADGSDVGALVGALAGAVTNLFGPGGLDVPGLLGTATNLISGLLAGDENFGKVLGNYVGIALDGFSGGGADGNGLFFGNLLGTIIAQLSADPDDEDKPLRPALFVDKFFNGFQQAKRKGGNDDDANKEPSGGSDLFGFISKIVSSVVGGVTSIILNSVLGLSGGSSQGSGDFSAPSKHPGHPSAD